MNPSLTDSSGAWVFEKEIIYISFSIDAEILNILCLSGSFTIPIVVVWWLLRPLSESWINMSLLFQLTVKAHTGAEDSPIETTHLNTMMAATLPRSPSSPTQGMPRPSQKNWTWVTTWRETFRTDWPAVLVKPTLTLEHVQLSIRFIPARVLTFTLASAISLSWFSTYFFVNFLPFFTFPSFSFFFPFLFLLARRRSGVWSECRVHTERKSTSLTHYIKTGPQIPPSHHHLHHTAYMEYKWSDIEIRYRLLFSLMSQV